MSRRLAVGAVTFLLGAGWLIADAPARAPLPLSAPLQDKNFFVLTLLEQVSPSDAELKDLLRTKQEVLRNCADVACFTSKMRFTDDEIALAAGALTRLYRSEAAIREMTNGALRRSGTYIRYHDKDGEALLDAAWRDAALGINHVIDVYGAGTAPRYAEIDSVAFNVKSPAYAQLVRTVADSLNEESAKATLFFQPTMRFALYLLQINRRDEAGRYEPLETGENAAALRRIRTISWNDFPYSLILVPGYGPDRAAWNLAPEGRLRLEIAVRRYKDGKAPFIVVSGGRVHPNQTAYCEAIEMKKALIDEFGVPPDRIIVEPHARHTTTNLRNVSRIMYRYGIPFERKALITTDRFQSAYIESEGFAKRCEQELGYQPARLLGRVSLFDLEFTPQLDALQIDAMEPLDP
jgi:hypothetical protein